MEIIDLEKQDNFKKGEPVDIQQQVSTPLNKTNLNQSLTNEQKLIYLSKLIQNAEKFLESNDISKKLVRKDDNLK